MTYAIFFLLVVATISSGIAFYYARERRCSNYQLLAVAEQADGLRQQNSFQQRLLQTLSDSSSNILVRYDAQCRRTLVNSAWEKISGIAAPDAIGTTPVEQPGKLENPQDFQRRIEAVLISAQPARIKLTWENADHQPMQLSLIAVPVTGQQGEVNALVVSDNDDCCHRLRELLEAPEPAAPSLAEATQESALQDAMRQVKLRESFMAQMSHEMRTPLNGILGYTQLMLRNDEIAVNQKAELKAIEHSSTHLLSLIDDMLDHDKLEADKLLLDVDTVRLDQFTDGLIAMIRPKIEEKKLKFSSTLAGDLPDLIQADPKRLRQVLLNLLSNAIKFTPSGEISLDIECATPKRLRFLVRDTGVGISAEAQQSIFQPYEKSPVNNDEGNGLGLAISQKLVSLMGGQLWLDSEPGQGSLFVCELPLIDANQTRSNKSASTARKYRVVSDPQVRPPAPPRPDLERLHGYALRGNMSAIIDNAHSLEQADASAKPFTQELLRLAGEYQSQAILEFISEYMECDYT